MKIDDFHWFCQKCFNNSVQFSGTPNEILKLTLNGKNPDYSPVLISNQDDSFVTLLKELEKIEFFNDPDNDTSDLDPAATMSDSKYYTLSEFNDIKVRERPVSFYHQNIASLSLHFDELSTILSNTDTIFDFIGITETGLNARSSIHDLVGYEHLDCPTESSKGGVRLYFSNRYNFKETEDLCLYESKLLESVFVEILSNQPKQNIIVGCIYKHPEMAVSQFNKAIYTMLEKVSRENKKILLMGDFNIDLLKIDIHDESSSYFDIISSFGLLPTILRPTRITCRSKTLIDNIFCNFSDIDTISGNLTCSISDHLPQFSLFNFSLNKYRGDKTTFMRNYSQFNRDNFLLDFFDIDWKHVLKSSDPGKNLNDFISRTNDLINQHVPLKKVRHKDIPRKPWITKGILTSIRHKNALYKKFIVEKNAQKKEELHSNFKSYRNWLTKILRLSKTSHYKAFFDMHKTNLRETWQGIRSLVSYKSRKNSSPSSLLINKVIQNDPLTIANCFNEYFGSIASKTKAKIRPINKSFADYLCEPNQSSMFFSPINAIEIGKIIQSLHVNKAQGPSSIPTNFLKLLSPTCSEILSDIFNSCLTLGIYPSCLKCANVIPVFKKGSPLDSCNYRPISLLSNVNKIFEKLLHSRLSSFLDKYSCLYPLQFGFRKGHSTAHAVMYLTELIRDCIDKGKFACGVFLDLQKAFDTVDHSILLTKMSHYGIRGKANSLFKSYLEDRSQYVTIDGRTSEKCSIKHGVPQGSVLGPLLFLIYINDLNFSIKHSRTIHFADDTSLLNCNRSLKKLNKQVNHDLRLLNEWLRSNKISLNADKTEIILFRSSARKAIRKSLNFRINGQKILPKSSVTYLGVKINQFLSWKDHFMLLESKLSRANGILAKLRHYVSQETLINVYHAIFNSHLNYCLLVWGKLPNYITDKIRSLQNSALRLIHFKTRSDRTAPLYRSSQILPFKAQLIKYQCLFAFDQLRKATPTVFSDFCLPISDTHDHDTVASTQQLLSIPRTNTVNYGTNSAKTQVVKSWNSIIPCLEKQLHVYSKFMFCKEINRILFNNLIMFIA